jgi:hypothetical protein
VCEHVCEHVCARVAWLGLASVSLLCCAALRCVTVLWHACEYLLSWPSLRRGQPAVHVC